MATREEIREEVGEIYVNNCRVGMDANEFSEELFNYLHSQDVVIIKNRKLPSIFDGKGEAMSALEYKKKLEGYVAVEPLI